MKLDIAELKKRWETRAVLAITIESGRIAVDFLRRDTESASPATSFSLPQGADAVLSAPEKIGNELAARLDEAGIRERRCVVCIPPGWALTTSAEIPGISSEDLRGYLELRAEREFPISPAELRLAHSAFTLADGKPRATLAGVPTKRIAAVEKMLETAGCRIVSLSLGLDRCLAPVEAPPTLHFLANGNHIDVVVAAGGGIAALRVIPGAAADDPAGFSREVRITLGRLPDVMRQDVHQAHFGGAPDSAEKLCLEVRNHLQRLGIESYWAAPKNAAGDPVIGNPGVALEAARLHLRQESVIFEFVEPSTNRWEATFQKFDSSRRRWIVAAVGLFVVLPILFFIVRSSTEGRLETEWNGMRKKVAELETIQQEIRKFRPWFDTVPQNLQLLESLNSTFPEQGDVWAKSIQIMDGSKVTCSGLACTQPALMAMFERLRARTDVSGVQVIQVRGENPVQFSVSFKWEPQDAK